MNFNTFLELGKIRIAQLVGLSTATGYILARGKIDFEMILPLLAVLLLAMGAGALNQYQERKIDAKMPRTKNRPIPSGRVSAGNALALSIILILSGAVILYVSANITAVILGLLTVLWYNGIYTPLKKITPLAVVPGSVIGSLPPLIGWASAGISIFQPRAFLLAAFFFIWQIPHFWLLLLSFGDDYEKAGFPSLTALLSNRQLGRMTFIWIVATAVCILFIPLFGFNASMMIYLLILAASVWLIFHSIGLVLPNHRKTSFRSAFTGINVFILLVMFLLTVDRLM